MDVERCLQMNCPRWLTYSVSPRENMVGPGEPGLGHLVVKQHAGAGNLVAGADARPVEPPLVAAEQHVGAGYIALDGGRGAVAVVGAHGERLRRDQFAEAAVRRLGHRLVEIQRVAVLHALGPAPDVVGRDRVFHLSVPSGTPIQTSTGVVSSLTVSWSAFFIQ